MTLFVDSTALIALGEIDAIDLLRLYSTPIVITPSIQLEVRRAASQVEAALAHGWMTIEHPNESTLNELIESSGLDEGEASLIDVAQRIGGTDPTLLIDERRAFAFLRETAIAKSLCLAQILHTIERTNPAVSCRDIMDELVRTDRYRWAKPVREEYLRWCETERYESVVHRA